MGFFGNVIKGFKEATKAGEDFNPALDKLMQEIEQLHKEGHLDDVLYKAEQAYEKEHEKYTAKGIHTDAADSAADVRAMGHFMKALEGSVDKLDPNVQADAKRVLDLKDKMEHILGNVLKKE